MRGYGFAILFSINVTFIIYLVYRLVKQADIVPVSSVSTTTKPAEVTTSSFAGIVRRKNQNSIILNNLEQDDPRLIAEIRRRFLIPPPPPNTPLFLLSPNVADRTQGQLKFLREFFNETRDGFFIEVGGFDGETYSNSMYFEQNLGWSGVMIEAEPTQLKHLKEKQRNVWIVPTCLSITGKPSRVKFQVNGPLSKIEKSGSGDCQVQCLPFYSILLALNITYIDYFSLDVEGAEFEVIKTIPWDKFKVKFMTVEFNHVPEGRQPVVDYMLSKGFKSYIKDFPNELKNQDVMFTRD